MKRGVANTANNVAIQCNFFLRIVTILQVCVKQALLDVLHDPNYTGLPLKNAQNVHKELLKFKNGPQGLKLSKKNILKDFQWQILCHVCTTCAANCQLAGTSDSQSFDITIIVVLIRSYLQGVPQQIAIASNDARELRNETMGHGSPHQIATQQEFDDYCKKIKNILLGLGYNNMKLFVDLQTSSLEPYLSDQLKFLTSEQIAMKTEQAMMKAEQTMMKAEQTTMKAEQASLKSEHTALKSDQEIIKSDYTELKAQNEESLKHISSIIDKLLSRINYMELNRKRIEAEAAPDIESNLETKRFESQFTTRLEI